MKRSLLTFFALAVLAMPAAAGSRAQIGGNANIDAQWIWQLRKSPAVCGNCVPIDLTGRAARAQQRVIVLPRQRQRVVPAQVQAAPRRAMDPAYLPAVVEYDGRESPGTIVVDTRTRHLYYVLEGGKAQRYGVGVGRDGFGWSGTVKVGRKAEWPTWTPPAAMRKRQPYLPVSMAGGPDNPLGARAIYLYDGGRDTLFRIHGSNEPWTIGHAVSSGCFRMRNEDVTELYSRVKIGTRVVVR
jgi:lipoprotein-anchoring transpeptidase ErfK/SrfK